MTTGRASAGLNRSIDVNRSFGVMDDEMRRLAASHEFGAAAALPRTQTTWKEGFIDSQRRIDRAGKELAASIRKLTFNQFLKKQRASFEKTYWKLLFGDAVTQQDYFIWIAYQVLSLVNDRPSFERDFSSDYKIRFQWICLVMRMLESDSSSMQLLPELNYWQASANGAGASSDIQAAHLLACNIVDSSTKFDGFAPASVYSSVVPEKAYGGKAWGGVSGGLLLAGGAVAAILTLATGGLFGVGLVATAVVAGVVGAIVGATGGATAGHYARDAKFFKPSSEMLVLTRGARRLDRVGKSCM